jgi:glycosyltransferase involved in cell wall biosynthesis
MKILYLTHHLKGNDGWSRYARDLALGVKMRGDDVICLVNEIDPLTDVVQKKVFSKGPLSYIVNPLINILDAYKVNRIIKEFNPDIIHVLVEPYGALIPFINKNNSKIVVMAYSTYAYLPIVVKGMKRKFVEILTSISLGKIDSIICISKYTKEYLRGHAKDIIKLSVLDRKISIVGGGVNEVQILKKAVPPLYNSPKEILFVGALKPRKGLIEAIEALRFVKSDYIYRIVGSYISSDPYIKLVNKKISEYNLQNKIILCGQVSDSELESMYMKADLFLMLSTNNGVDFEGYGLVYIEANSKGVPVIGPSDSGVSDAIISGKTGYLVNQFDSQNVAKVIENVLQNNPIKSSDCIAWALENTVEKKVSQIIEIYKIVINK